MNKRITISLAGDVLISRRLPMVLPHDLKEIQDIMLAQDCRFGNLEATVHDCEGYPEAFPGGSYLMAPPLCVCDLKALGFNVFNTANNHSMDYSHGGLLATLQHLDEQGLPHCGTGKNLSAATAPAFVECQQGRVAFVGVTSSFHDSYAAGPQNQDMQGRPGVAPLRHKAVYELDEENFINLVRIADVSGINNYHNQARKEGYLPQTEEFKFGTYNFRKGSENRLITTPNDSDLQRTIKSIIDARYFADIVVVSIHGHQFEGTDKHNVPGFVRQFSQQCIEAGADIIVCHGPHVMRGIELYGRGIIFHGLGNFMLQHESVTMVGEEQYLKAGTTRQASTGVAEVMNLRSKHGKVGLNADRDAWYSYFVTLEWLDGRMKSVVHPIEIHREKNNGLPFLSHDISILEQLQSLSEEMNLVMTIDRENVKGIIG